MYKFEKLTVWKEAFSLVKIAYNTILKLPINEKYGLCDQARRASMSVMLNIAEGSGAESDKEFLRYLYLSRKSLYEVVAITRFIESEYPQIDIEQLNNQIVVVSKLLSGLINKLKSIS